MSRAELGTPSTNRGFSETERIGVVIDWLAFSVDLLSVLESRNMVDDRQAMLADMDGRIGDCVPLVAEALAGFYFGDLFACAEPSRGRFYAWMVRLLDAAGEKVGQVEFGGVNTIRQDGTRTARIELTGQGCRQFETSNGSDHAQRWLLLASLLGVTDARITRIDIAADDFAGAWPVAWAIEQYGEGAFDKRGQRPKARLIDDMGNRTGKTFYVGSRQAENQLRVYEKGREQGDKDSEWVRYEGEFHASIRRELPLDMLTDPAPYLVGAYPALHFVDGIGERLRIAAAEIAATCKRAVEYFRRNYGPMVNALLHASGGDVQMLSRLMEGTARPKLPGWCPNIDATQQLVAQILFAPVGQISDASAARAAEDHSGGMEKHDAR